MKYENLCTRLTRSEASVKWACILCFHSIFEVEHVSFEIEKFCSINFWKLPKISQFEIFQLKLISDSMNRSFGNRKADSDE